MNPPVSYSLARVDVYKEKGGGFLDAVDQECLEIELGIQGIEFAPQPRLKLEHKGQRLHREYVRDLICFGKIVVVELKTGSSVFRVFCVFRGDLTYQPSTTEHTEMEP